MPETNTRGIAIAAVTAAISKERSIILVLSTGSPATIAIRTGFNAVPIRQVQPRAGHLDERPRRFRILWNQITAVSPPRGKDACKRAYDPSNPASVKRMDARPRR